MMQSVSVEDLRDEPFRSLWYLHIQPPVYNGIRALLALGAGTRDARELAERVDRRLYVLWAVLFGALGWVVFRWLSAATSRGYAAAAALVFLLHPATIFYATLLDSTLLSALLVTVLLWSLARARRVPAVPPAALAAAFVALYLTRTVVQWPWLALLAVSLWVLEYPRRLAIRCLVVAAVVVCLFTVKQQALFGLWSTSSFSWMNLCNSVRGCEVGNPWREIVAAGPAAGSESRPRVLTRRIKLDPHATANLNHWTLLAKGERWRSAYFARLEAMSLRELARNYAENAHLYLRPSSRYTRHVLVDRLPYRALYDSVFSGWTFLALLLAASIHWVARNRTRELRSAVGLLLPLGAIVLVSVLCERGENMRFKYFVEPALFVFVAGELYRAGRGLVGWATQRRPGELDAARSR